MEPFENEADESEQQVDNTAFVQETENTALSDASPIQEKQGDVEPDTTELDPQINEQDDEQIERVVNGQDKPADQGATEFDTIDDDDAEDDDEDDVVNVIIKPSNQGSIYKTGTAYQARSHVLHPQIPKPTRQGVNLGDPGNIQGVPTIDFNLTTLGDEEKPWKRPGADITDYFNYGFTEETWTQYCEKQKIIRQEYANSTIKPLLVGTATGLGFNGLTLAQRNRFVGLPSRSFDSYKSAANINVINLSSSNARSGVGLLSPTRDMDSDEDETKSNLGVSDGSIAFGGSSLGPGFSMPPPGYSADQSAALAQLNTAAAAAAVNAFNLPPPVFGNTAAAASGVFPNTAVPPPAMSSNLFAHQQQQSAWPPSSVSNGLISLLAGSGVRHAGLSGRMTSDNRGQTPEDLFSDDEYQDSRRRRHNAEEETDDRDQYRSSRRSRSRSRERRYSSRSKRHHEESSSRDYSRHGEHRSHRRSRDHHHSRSERNSLAVSGSVSGDYPGEGGGSSSRRSRERSSVRRDSRRSDRESRDPGSISRSSRRQRMTSRSPDRIISYKRGRSPLSRSNSPHLMRQSSSPTAQKQPPIDPLTAAAAAAADIAARLSRVDNEHMFG